MRLCDEALEGVNLTSSKDNMIKHIPKIVLINAGKKRDMQSPVQFT